MTAWFGGTDSEHERNEMNTQEIEKRAIRTIKEQLCYRNEKVEPAMTFRGDLGMDSLDEIELVMALEEEFEIGISDDDAEKISTVKEAIEYLTKRVTPNVVIQGPPTGGPAGMESSTT